MMYIKPSNPVPGSSAVELWDDERHAATIYAQRGGIHIICESGYEPGHLAVEVQKPTGVQITITRAD
jgi:hypothetical protein